MVEKDADVEALMSTPVKSVKPDASLADAAQILTEESIGSLIVGEEQLNGIITETDIVAAVGDEIESTTSVKEFMSDPVVTIHRDGSLRTAAERMGYNGVKKLPVVEDGAAVGIITTTDLALHLPEYQVRMAQQADPEIVDGEWE